MLQARLLADVMEDEQLFLLKIHGYKVKGEKEEGYQDFSQGFNAMKAMFGGGF